VSRIKGSINRIMLLDTVHEQQTLAPVVCTGQEGKDKRKKELLDLGPFAPETAGQSEVFGLTKKAVSVVIDKKQEGNGHTWLHLRSRGVRWSQGGRTKKRTFGMDGSQVGVFEERDEIGLGGFLQSHDGGGLEAQVGLERGMSVVYGRRGRVYLEVLRNLTNKTLEGQLPDEELGRLLVPPDLTKSDRSRAESVRLLHTTSGGLFGREREREERERMHWPLRSSLLPWWRAACAGPCLWGCW
jgi:hypothetical protein